MRKYYLTRLFALALALVLLCSATALAADGDYYQMLINKQHTLDASYAPTDLVRLNEYISAGSSVTMTRAAAEALQTMVQGAEAAGYSGVYGTSGYRSYDTQTYLYQRKTNYYRNQGYSLARAKELAATVVAPPGASEHQSGMAIDVSTAAVDYGLVSSFGQTGAGRWLAAHCWEYGFILRYPEDKVDITGYIYEPWHFRYVGKTHAEYMYKNGLCLEEYLDLLQTEQVLGLTASDSVSYAVYYSSYDNSAALPGRVLSVSYADAPYYGYVITTVAPDILLYDLVGHWSEPEIRPLVELGVVQGYPSNIYRPNRNISRAELVSLTARVADLELPGLLPEAETADAAEDVFVDADAGDYFFSALSRLYQAELLPDVLTAGAAPELTFSPNQPVLRSEAALLLAPLFAGLDAPAEHAPQLADMAAADEQLQAAVQTLADFGVVQGNASGNFAPNSQITRAEIGAMLMRIISFYQD